MRFKLEKRANPSTLMLYATPVGAVLVTGNVREFSRVDGLRVVDWGDR